TDAQSATMSQRSSTELRRATTTTSASTLSAKLTADRTLDSGAKSVGVTTSRGHQSCPAVTVQVSRTATATTPAALRHAVATGRVLRGSGAGSRSLSSG